MKVLVLNKMYYPDIGGVETVVKQYSEFLLENKNYKVSVLTAGANQRIKISKEIINGVEIIRCPSFGMFFSMPISLSIIFVFFKIVNNYDIIHIHEPYPIGTFLFLFAKKQKKIVTYHCDIVNKNKILKFFVNQMQKRNLGKAHVITTTSNQLLSSSNILKPYKNKTKVIPLSCDEKHLNITFDSDYFLIIGRLSNYKGLNVLISSVKAGLDIKKKILVVGKGEPKIEDEIMKLKEKGKLEFLNEFVSEKIKFKLIKNCYALVFPSTLNSEAFGIIQIEAMSFGKPIINTYLDTAVPWVSINDITGYTVEPDNAKELSEAIRKIDRLSRKKYIKFCNNSYERFQKNFNNKIVKNELLNLYREL